METDEKNHQLGWSVRFINPGKYSEYTLVTIQRSLSTSSACVPRVWVCAAQAGLHLVWPQLGERITAALAAAGAMIRRAIHAMI